MGELYSLINNGETAENVAEKYQVSRKDQDELAFASHQKALKAQQDGRLKDEIVPYQIAQRNGAPLVHDKDEDLGPTHRWRFSPDYGRRLRKTAPSPPVIPRRFPTAPPRC